MTVDYPAAGQISGLRALWKEAFGDSDVFLDAFFAHGFSPSRCLQRWTRGSRRTAGTSAIKKGSRG